MGQDLARQLFAAVARGETDLVPIIQALVNAVLDHEVAQLARAAQEPGPHQLCRALELAGALSDIVLSLPAGTSRRS